MSRLVRLCRPPKIKHAIESQAIELAGEQLNRYQTCLKRASLESEGSQTFFSRPYGARCLQHLILGLYSGPLSPCRFTASHINQDLARLDGAFR